MNEKRKINFFKRLKMSILEFENYIEFTAEKFGKSIGFMIKTVLLLALIVIISNTAYIYLKYKGPVNCADSILPEFTYENEKLTINEEDKKKANKKPAIEVMQELEITYKEFLKGTSFSKSDIIKLISEQEINTVIIISISIFIVVFLYLFIFWISIALLTSLVGLIVLRFSRIKMRYSKLYPLAVYASTLSVILTVLYSLLNNYLYVYIDGFEYLTMLISYVYITAVIYMIRSDLIKQQFELIKIATVQAQVKEEMKRKEEKEKRKQEKDKEEPEDKKEGEQEEDLGEPDGSEI